MGAGCDGRMLALLPVLGWARRLTFGAFKKHWPSLFREPLDILGFYLILSVFVHIAHFSPKFTDSIFN